MQFQVNPSPIRNSTGFSFPEGFSNRNNTAKGFPVQPAKSTTPRNEDLCHKIQDLEEKDHLF